MELSESATRSRTLFERLICNIYGALEAQPNGIEIVRRSGKELDETTVRTRVKVGVPVRVHYAGEGDSMLVDRVVLDED
jgi:hypothetical protein